MDIIAREVLIYFDIALPDTVYYYTARTILLTQRTGDSLIPRLDNPGWKDEFSNYRNALTHEVLIARNYNINVNDNGLNVGPAGLEPATP